ncbi:Small COPII coat GTPase SAR1 [Mycena venus]|uniref:Small COPII coat GTPase SAR1 n=1 Tax=Mycena venus TaxID=2733690 RepID=A0A8H7CLL9_9AGAR|nr:Small COPII coat GTPase SAR1 [Mycena venus]
MFIINWFRDILAQPGLMHKNAKILFLGLDNTGKSKLPTEAYHTGCSSATIDPDWHGPSRPLCTRLKTTGSLLCSQPSTRRRRSLRLATLNSRLTILVDINMRTDSDQFSESKVKLDAPLAIEQLAKVSFLILGNKIDTPGAVSEEKLRHHLGLYQTTGKGKIPPTTFSPSKSSCARSSSDQGTEKVTSLSVLLDPILTLPMGVVIAELNITVGSVHLGDVRTATCPACAAPRAKQVAASLVEKYLFAACDVFNGVLIYDLLVSFVLPSLQTHSSEKKATCTRALATLYSVLHLNPHVFTISTRGSWCANE